MLKTYKSIRNEKGDLQNGRTKLFITTVDSDGSIGDFSHGIAIVPEGSGSLFIVDDYLINQLDKLLFLDGELVVKDGETIEEPEKSAKEKERERLLAQLAALDAEPDSPEPALVNINTADITELTTLEGIGETKAQAIIDYRTENGPFEAVEGLLNVSGIGDNLFASIQSYIAV